MEEHKARYSNAFSATISGILDLFRPQKNQVSINEAERLTGKHILITGASSGLGLEAAVQLARLGGNVWMACRSGIPEKGEYVKQQSGSNHVQMLPVDLSDMDSIKALVHALKSKGIQLDIVVSNAAVVPLKGRKTKQGLEEMFMVNYLAPYLLMRLLLDENLIRTTGSQPPRLIFVSSESHRNPQTYDWEEFGQYRDYGPGKSVEIYGYTKLMLSTFVAELSRRLNSATHTQYSTFALCPGPVNSNIARESPALFKPLLKLVFALFFKSPTQAVKPIVYFATSSEVTGKPLDYLFLMGRKEMDEKATQVANGQKLWRLSEELLAKHGISFQKSHFHTADTFSSTH